MTTNDELLDVLNKIIQNINNDPNILVHFKDSTVIQNPRTLNELRKRYIRYALSITMFDISVYFNQHKIDENNIYNEILNYISDWSYNMTLHEYLYVK